MAARRVAIPVFLPRSSTRCLRLGIPLAATSRPVPLLRREVSVHALLTRGSISLPPPAAVGNRAYSQSQTPPSQSKIWSFDDIQRLSSEADSKVVIVDTREPAELQTTGRIPHAINIPITSAPDSFHVGDDEFEDRFGFARPAREQEVVFYCRAGVRSRAAAGLAREAGWTAVGEYPGSWLEWEAKGGKVER